MPNLPPGSSVLTLVSVTQPAAGLPATFNLPPRVRWRLNTFTLGLETSAATADRIVTLWHERSGVRYWRIPATTAIPANSTLDISFMSGLGQELGSPATVLAIPLGTNILLSGGDRLVLFIINMQSADQIENPSILVEQWIEI